MRGSTTIRSSVRGGTTTTVRSSATATSSTSTARSSAGEPQVREPLVDVFDEGEQIVVVAELPGVQMADIRVQINADVLALETTGERRYEKEILLPAAIDPTTIQQTYRNGILELRLLRLDEA
ncbi:MAG: Hsp20/alpha crystallin family protein [Chloroflexaceae bacterium]|nr:Hsp20/alpha crystallin family protein [Chloroflexaceae bacterium]